MRKKLIAAMMAGVLSAGMLSTGDNLADDVTLENIV